MTNGSGKGEKDKGGRPPLYATPEQLQDAVDGYFTFCAAEKELITITGLALHLGFSSRQGLSDQQSRGEEFSDVIKSAKLRVENAYERQLYRDKPTGAIFALKQMGWRDEQHRTVDANVNNNHNVHLTPREATQALINTMGEGDGIDSIHNQATPRHTSTRSWPEQRHDSI